MQQVWSSINKNFLVDNFMRMNEIQLHKTTENNQTREQTSEEIEHQTILKNRELLSLFILTVIARFNLSNTFIKNKLIQGLLSHGHLTLEEYQKLASETVGKRTSSPSFLLNLPSSKSTTMSCSINTTQYELNKVSVEPRGVISDVLPKEVRWETASEKAEKQKDQESEENSSNMQLNSEILKKAKEAVELEKENEEVKEVEKDEEKKEEIVMLSEQDSSKISSI